MIIQKTYSYRLKPTKAQRLLFERYSGCARFVYNHGLSLLKEALNNNQEVSTYFDLTSELPLLKKNPENYWLLEPPAQILQQSLRNLVSAFKRSLREVGKKKRSGFPKFKKKGAKDSVRFPQGVKIKAGKIKLPKIGLVAYRNSRPIEGKIKQAIIKREGLHWKIHISCEIEMDIQKVPIFEKNAVGIDVGLKNFAYLSDGQVVENVKLLIKYLKKLACLQRQYSRKKKGSNNQKKCAMKVAKLHRVIKNMRTDFLHKLSTNIAKNHGVVAVENLNIKGLVRNKSLSRAVSDAAWGRFVGYLEYKCEWLGKHFVKVGRFLPSTKQCSSCGNLQNISLQTRIYKCAACGLQLDRDLNASINIRTAGLAVLKACGEISVG